MTGRTSHHRHPVVLRHGIEIDDPVGVALGFLDASRQYDLGAPSGAAAFVEADLRHANRAGARISACEIGSILARRRAIERALAAIAPDASLAGAVKAVPWLPLAQLLEAFANIHGVGFSKTTKALHPKRPALIPILDSVVRRYLASDDPGSRAPFGVRSLALVRGYKSDLDRNRAAVRATRQELARRDYRLTEVRILDLLIWSVEATRER
jgi:hypothetical protein